MSVKTNELQQVSSTSAEDFLLVDSPTGGTVRVPLSVAAEYFDGALLQPETALSAALSSKANWEMLPNQNILDNGDFKHVVNQNSVDRYTSSGKMIYTIDRWALGGNTDISEWSMRIIENSGITLAKGSALIQYFEEIRWPVGSQLTFSAMIDGKVYSISFVADTISEYAGVTFENGLRLAWNGSGRYVQIYNHAGTGSELVTAAKLEPGIHQTLAHKEGNSWMLNNPSPNKVLELLKCQRYQYKAGTNGTDFIRAARISPAHIFFDVPTPVPMRSNPVIKNIENIEIRNLVQVSESETPITGFSYSVINTGSGLRIDAYKISHGLQDACLFVSGVLFDSNV